MAAAIWIFIKLPQEYWIHIAELDVTDQQARHPWLLPVFFSALAVVLLIAWQFRSRLPPWDRRPDVDVDAHIDRPPSAAVTPRRDVNAILSVAVLEKVLLLSTIAVIFSQVLDGIRAKLGATRQVENIKFLAKNSASQPAPKDLLSEVAANYRGALLAIAD